MGNPLSSHGCYYCCCVYACCCCFWSWLLSVVGVVLTTCLSHRAARTTTRPKSISIQFVKSKCSTISISPHPIPTTTALPTCLQTQPRTETNDPRRWPRRVAHPPPAWTVAPWVAPTARRSANCRPWRSSPGRLAKRRSQGLAWLGDEWWEGMVGRNGGYGWRIDGVYGWLVVD